MTRNPLIVGTDLGEQSVPAIVQGAAWAQLHELSLIVVHVDTTWTVTPPDTKEHLEAVEKWVSSHTNVHAEIVVCKGSSHAELIRLAGERQAEMLVVGGSGEGSLTTALLGSTASSVVRYAECSVLIARESNPHGPVVLGTDFSDAVKAALEVAAREAKQRDTELVLLHSMYEPESPLRILGPVVFSPPVLSDEAVQEMRAAAETTLRSLLEGQSTRGRTALVDDEPAAALKEYCRQAKAGLLVVGTHGRTGFARMALGSVAERVAHNAPCSVLVVRTR